MWPGNESILTTREPAQGCFLAVGTTKPCTVWLPELCIYLLLTLWLRLLNSLILLLFSNLYNGLQLMHWIETSFFYLKSPTVVQYSYKAYAKLRMIKRTLDHWMQILLLCVQNPCYESTGLCGICVEPQFLLFDRKYREKNLKRETKMLKWCKKIKLCTAGAVFQDIQEGYDWNVQNCERQVWCHLVDNDLIVCMLYKVMYWLLLPYCRYHVCI